MKSIGSIARNWAVIKRHVPMIKFRKPPNNSMMIENVDHSHAQAQLVPNHPGTSGIPQNTKFASFVLEDWQLAGKYKRKAITEEEIGYINRGGPQ